MPIRRTRVLRLLCAALAAAAAVLTTGRSAADAPTVPDVRSFAYQLQQCVAPTLHAQPHDMLIVDVADDYVDWTPDQVASMRDGPCGPRLVLAYLSVGEAEDFRWYAGDLPADLLAGEVRARPGNRRVRFWDARWQAMLYGTQSGPAESSLDRIIDQGFDGVVLDHLDAFEAFLPGPGGAGGENPTAANDMLSLIESIGNHARGERARPDFVVLAQDGTSIVERRAHPGSPDPKTAAADAETRYLGAVDGIVATDTFFSGHRRIDNPYQPRLYVLERLDRFRARDEPVFAVEYVGQRHKVKRFHKRCAAHGFIGFATNRALKRAGSSRYAPPVPGCR